VLDLSRLSPAQREAVLAPDGPLLIVAGPGSGKTTVLAARIAYLVTARQVPPSSILALTFTTAAGRELRARLVGLLAEDARGVDALTFHALGLRLVRMWGEELGLGPGPVSVYGADDARELLCEAAACTTTEAAEWDVDELQLALDRFRLTGADEGEAERLHSLADEYEALLRRRGAVDYPAMLAWPLRLFRDRPDAMRLLQDTYRHVLCDELQDVCPAQYALLRLLAERHRNLVVVGDPAQTLYGWRGADLRFLLGFQSDFPDVRILTLDQNFRATGRIVDLANSLGASLPYGHSLWTQNPPGERAVVFVAGDAREEAGFVATQIRQLRSEDVITEYGAAAVLYRTNGQAQEIALALRAAGVPYHVRGSGDLFGRRDVQDAVAYLRLAYNPGDAAALARIVNVPPRRLGRIAQIVARDPVTLSDLPELAIRLGPAAQANAEALVKLVGDLNQRANHVSTHMLLDFALNESGYRAWLAGRRDGPTRLASLAALRSLAQRAEGDLGSWLAEIQVGEDPAVGHDDRDRVLLTSIHGAKGREWRVVFAVGLEEGLLPHVRALVSDSSYRASGRPGLEEELRVAYVAVTRPRERLFLSWCRTRERNGQPEARYPSRFLQALPSELLERAA
jgi:DNA helicase-2/ATP-dependent DNA helicase PcrA